jgi:hypothetical protein
MSKIKTFRGLMTDGSIEKVRLSTIDGTTGYKIKRFDLFPVVQDSPKDSLVCISKTKITTAITSADFSDQTLLAAALMFNGTYEIQQTVVFDNETLNQDIYISNVDSIGSNSMNYYLELEQVKLDSNETAVATLKNIKNR